MTRIKSALGLAAFLCLGAFAANAADPPSQRAKEKGAEPRTESRSLTWGRHEQDGAPRSSRLKFRSADGTCACSCARGGITEEEIRRAQQARDQTQS